MNGSRVELRVGELAQAQGLTKQSLMERCHAQGSRIAYSSVSDYWSNKVERYDRATLAALARALGVKVHQLFADAPDPRELPGSTTQTVMRIAELVPA